MIRPYTLFHWLRNLLAIVGAVALWIAIGLAHAGYFKGIDLSCAAMNAAWTVLSAAGWIIAVVVVAIVGPSVIQVICSRWERNRNSAVGLILCVVLVTVVGIFVTGIIYSRLLQYFYEN